MGRVIGADSAHSIARTPSPTATAFPIYPEPFVIPAFVDWLVLEPLDSVAEIVATLPLPVPEFGGMLVGVNRTSSVFVQLVSLAVALPVIAPAVALPVSVK